MNKKGFLWAVFFASWTFVVLCAPQGVLTMDTGSDKLNMYIWIGLLLDLFANIFISVGIFHRSAMTRWAVEEREARIVGTRVEIFMVLATFVGMTLSWWFVRSNPAAFFGSVQVESGQIVSSFVVLSGALLETLAFVSGVQLVIYGMLSMLLYGIIIKTAVPSWRVWVAVFWWSLTSFTLVGAFSVILTLDPVGIPRYLLPSILLAVVAVSYLTGAYWSEQLVRQFASDSVNRQVLAYRYLGYSTRLWSTLNSVSVATLVWTVLIIYWSPNLSLEEGFPVDEYLLMAALGSLLSIAFYLFAMFLQILCTKAETWNTEARDVISRPVSWAPVADRQLAVVYLVQAGCEPGETLESLLEQVQQSDRSPAELLDSLFPYVEKRDDALQALTELRAAAQ